jgi:hypothetical protein
MTYLKETTSGLALYLNVEYHLCVNCASDYKNRNQLMSAEVNKERNSNASCNLRVWRLPC